VTASESAAWARDVSAADWLTRELKRAEWGTVAALVPSGFEAYCRLLHPAYADNMSTQRLQWSEVASWSGRTLDRLSQFHSVAFPVSAPNTPTPWFTAPVEGSMDPRDLEALVNLLGQHTQNPDDCWFGIWDGYGVSIAISASSGNDSAARTDTMPKRHGPPPDIAPTLPKVLSLNREYYLLHGSLQTAREIDRYADIPAEGPSVFWPTDHAWCVSTDVDLSWTYVGGTRALVDALLASEGVEAVPAETSDPCGRFEPWVEELASKAANSLVRSGSAVINTPLGEVRASIRKHRRNLELWTFGKGSSGRALLGKEPVEEHREQIEFYLGSDIVALAN
jgi:hypothetical protein